MHDETKAGRKRRHAAMLEQGMHRGNTDAKFDPPDPPTVTQRLPEAQKIE